MSYILDALKRADAERERGVVPGLYARQLTNPGSKSATAARRLLWLAIVLALTLGGIATGLVIWRTTSDRPHQAMPLPPMPQSTAAAPSPQPLPAPTPVAPAAAQQAPVVAIPVPVPVPVAVAAAAVRAASTPMAEVKPEPTAAPSPVSKASASRAAPATVALLGELPEDIRRQIPALTITGAVYSDNPGQRLLLVNNQVLTQGSQAAPEVNLEEIGAKSSLFSFRGTRFRLVH